MKPKSKIIRSDPDFIKEIRLMGWGSDTTATKRLAKEYLPYIRTGNFLCINPKTNKKKKNGGFDFIP